MFDLGSIAAYSLRCLYTKLYIYISLAACPPYSIGYITFAQIVSVYIMYIHNIANYVYA